MKSNHSNNEIGPTHFSCKGLSWDDRIPDDLKPIWNSHYEMMQEIGKVKFKHAVVPEDAVNLDVNTIDAADDSKKLACTAIYARFLKKDGIYSCHVNLLPPYTYW